MAISETPIFPGKVDNGQATVASGSSTSVAIYTAPASYPVVISGPIIQYLKSAVARTFRLELKDGSTVTVLGRWLTSGTQYETKNILSSTYIAGMDDDDPKIFLKAGQILQITPEDTNACAVDFTVLNVGTFEYPN